MSVERTPDQMIREMEVAGYIVVVDQTSAGVYRVRVSRPQQRFRQQTTSTGGTENAIRAAHRKWCRAQEETTS